jgi:hypothetical protein
VLGGVWLMDAGYLPAERRPATTRGFRRLPLGWTAPQVAEIAGIPVRTVQQHSWAWTEAKVQLLEAWVDGHGTTGARSERAVKQLKQLRPLAAKLRAERDRRVPAPPFRCQVGGR